MQLFMLCLCLILAVYSAFAEINPFIASENEKGIPYLRGENHVMADGGFFNAARNIVVSLWVLNDATWGANGLAAETPVVIRATWTQQVVVSQVLAATKKGGMLDRFRKVDGTFGVPDYKLSEEDLDCLYDDHEELDRFRATASATAMKRWIEHSYPESRWNSDMYQWREDFYEQLKMSSGRTHDMLIMFGLQDGYAIDVDSYDETSFCTSVSPQEIGEKAAMQINEYACMDGWNECGTTNESGMGSYGPQPYSDITGYYPIHGPNGKTNIHRWKPILETDGRGYYTRQEFVVPHIGATADTVYLSEKDRENIRKEFMMKPYNDYETLARNVLERTKNIANDEKEKTLIAWFDDKLNLAADTTAYFMFNPDMNWKLEDVAYYLQGYIMLEYDGIIVNWASKVENDHVRPTTVVQEFLSGEMTDNWARGVEGTSTYPAEQWTPYIRVMPHGEYPSGSACICTVVMKWSAEALGVGYDEDFPIQYSHGVGSNKFEPSLPKEEFTSEYRSHKEVADKCAISRVDGGMHFPDAIEAGDAMCGGDLVFRKGVAFQKYIWTGNEEFLDEWGGVKAFGHVASKECQYNARAPKKGKKAKGEESKFEYRIAGFSSNHYSICLQRRVFRENNVYLASNGDDDALESLSATVETTSTSLFNINQNLQRLTGQFDPKSFEKMAEQKVERQCELEAQVMVEKAVEDVINAQYKSGILHVPGGRDPPSLTWNNVDAIDVTGFKKPSIGRNEFQQLKSNSVFPLKQDGHTNSQDNLNDGLLVECKNFIADVSNTNVGAFATDSEIDMMQSSDPHSLDNSLDFHDIVIDVEDSTERLFDTTVEEAKEVPLEMRLTSIDISHDSRLSRCSYDNQMEDKSNFADREIESIANDKISAGSKQDVYCIDTVQTVMNVINNNIYAILEGTTTDYTSNVLGVVDLEDGLGIEHEESMAQTESFLISSPFSVDQKSIKTSRELRELELIAESKVEKDVEAQVEAETEALVEGAVIVPAQKQVEKKVQEMEEKAEAERVRAEADRLKLEQKRVEAERLKRAQQEEEEAKLRKRLEAKQLEKESLERKARIAYLERKNSGKRKQLYMAKLDRDRHEAEILEQEYAGLNDSEKAYKILVNLGLIQEHQDPISPQLDDEELAPTGVWL